jgi:uncharacterized membrane protein YhaH (DUF805 family)
MRYNFNSRALASKFREVLQAARFFSFSLKSGHFAHKNRRNVMTAANSAQTASGKTLGVAPGLFGYFLKCLKNPDFTGHASRKEFWGFSLFALAAQLILLLIVGAILAAHLRVFSGVFAAPAYILNFYSGPWPTLYKTALLLFSMPLIVSFFAVFFRRMHDIGRSGWQPILWFALASLCFLAAASWGWGSGMVYLMLYGAWFLVSVYLTFLLCRNGIRPCEQKAGH